jgi:pimeloyl-ACP methyl ester carboxylesterase
MTTGPDRLQTNIARPAWLPERQWPFQLRSVLVEGCRLHLIDEGSGPVLLLVHAGMWSFVWRDLIVGLSGDFRCVAVDFPGSGLSEAPGEYPVGLEPNSRLLEEVVDRLGLRDITLVAHDLGGLIGLGWAARHPDLVQGLVLMNTFGWPPRPALQAMLKLMGSSAMRTLNTATNLVPCVTSGRFGVGRHLSREARRAFLGPTRERARRRALHQLMADAARSTWLLQQLETELRTSLHDRPVLTVFGQYNDPFHFQRRWAELFPRAQQVVIARGNHFPMNDDPHGVAAAIRFWWQHSGSSPAAARRHR